MNFNDVQEYFPVGSNIRVISHGETTDGTIIKLNEPSIVIRRADNGRPKIIDCAKIETIDYLDMTSQPSHSLAPIEKATLATPLIYLPQQAAATFEHREYIKSRIKSLGVKNLSADWAQINNIFESAKKYKSLAEKQKQIFRQLESFVKNYPSNPAEVFAGDIYSAYNDWKRATAAYTKVAFYSEALACAMKVTDTKDFLIEVLRRQLLDKNNRTADAVRIFFYYAAELHYQRLVAELLEKISDSLTNDEREIACQGCYKILVNSGNVSLVNVDAFDYSSHGLQQLVDILKQAGQNEPPLILPEFEDEKPKASDAVAIKNVALKKGKLILFNQKNGYGFIDSNIYFRLEQVEDKGLRQALNKFGLWRDDIEVTYILADGKTGVAADHIKLQEGEDLPSETGEVHNGVLYFYDINDDYGQVTDFHNGSYYFKINAVLDPCLKRYLKDTFQIEDLNVEFTLRPHNKKMVVHKLRLTFDELRALSKRYGLAEPEEQPRLIDDVPKNLPQYQPLPPLRENKISTTPAKEPEYKLPIPKIYRPPSTYGQYKNNPTPYERGISCLRDKNYPQAEIYFEKAMQDEFDFAKALKSLLTVYKVDYDENTDARIEKGLQLLKEYESRLDKNTVITERIQLLNKAKRKDELIEALNEGIAVSYKVNQRMHYRLQLAGEYRLKKNYDAAIECYEMWLKEKRRYRDKLSPQIERIEHYVNQGLAVCLYCIGEKSRAKEIAKNILMYIPDNQTANSIMEDNFQEMVVSSEDSGNAFYDDADNAFYGDTDSLKLSPYAEYMRDQIILAETYSTAYQRIFRGKFDDVFNGDEFLGTPEDAAKIIDAVKGNLRNAGDKERSGARVFISKLISKVYSKYDTEIERCEKNEIGKRWELESTALFMGYAGDYELQQLLDCNVDVARFFYNEEIAMTPKNSDIDTRAYFIKFIASFFIEPNAVIQLKPSQRGSDKNAHLNYLKERRKSLAPRRLLVSTFLIPDNIQRRLSEFLDEMAKYPEWINEADQLFRLIAPELTDTLTEDNFKSQWQESKRVYLTRIERFLKDLKDAVKNYNNAGESGLDSFLQKIKNTLDGNFLSPTDQKRVEEYCKLLENISKIGVKSTFEEKEEEYIKVLDDSDELMKDIRKKPTKLSYETLYEVLEILHAQAEKELKKLYESSVPSLTIESNIIGADPVTFSVTVVNEKNCQTAVNMKIDVTGIGEKIEIRTLNRNTGALRGGDYVEFLYQALLDNKEKSRGYFEVNIKITYNYKVDIDEKKENSIVRDDNIPLINSADYEEIDNVYSNIVSSGSVPIESNLFYGRDEDINKIVQMLRLTDGSMLKNRCLVIHGQKRAGKTSIMNRLKQKIRDVYGAETYVVVSMGSAGEFQSFNSFLAAIIDKLASTLRRDHRPLYNYLKENGVEFAYNEIESNDISDIAKQGIFRRNLNGIIDKSREFSSSDSKYIPLFLIDEFTYFYQWIKDGTFDTRFMQFWKAFLQNNPVCAILVGMDHMPQFIAEYQNEFACAEEIQIHFLKEKDTKDLANKPILLKDGSSRYRDRPGEDALNYVYWLTAGSAYLTVIFCNALVDYLNERKTPYITRTVIDNFIREKFLGSRPVLQGYMFDPQLNDPGKFSEEEQKNTRQDNRTVLTYIAIHSDNVSHELHREKICCEAELSEKTTARRDIILDQLIRRRVLTKRGDYYKIEIELLRMWLRRERGDDF